MTNLSLGKNPPFIFRGGKGVNKKGKNLSKTIFSSRNNKNKSNSAVYLKNLEKEIRQDPKINVTNENYSDLEKTFVKENRTFSEKEAEFSESTSTNTAFNYNKFSYTNNEGKTFSVKEENTSFYNIDPFYSVGALRLFIKIDDNKEIHYSPSIERKDGGETFYVLLTFEEATKEEQKTVKWNAKEYSS